MLGDHLAAIPFIDREHLTLHVATGHSPGHTFARIFETAFTSKRALNDTLVSATPLLFTGLCAAVAFRMNLFNIGGEGQLFAGAILGSGIALALAGSSSPVSITAMILAGAALFAHMNDKRAERISRAIYEATLEAIYDGFRTADLSGTTTTSDFTNEVIRRVKTKIEVWATLA